MPDIDARLRYLKSQSATSFHERTAKASDAKIPTSAEMAHISSVCLGNKETKICKTT